MLDIEDQEEILKCETMDQMFKVISDQINKYTNRWFAEYKNDLYNGLSKISK